MTKEIEEIGEIIQDMMSKIDDSKASQKQLEESMKFIKQTTQSFYDTAFDAGFGSSKSESSSAFGLPGSSKSDVIPICDTMTVKKVPKATDQTPVSEGIVVKKVPKRKMDDDADKNDSKKVKTSETNTVITAEL